MISQGRHVAQFVTDADNIAIDQLVRRYDGAVSHLLFEVKRNVDGRDPPPRSEVGDLDALTALLAEGKAALQALQQANEAE